MKNLLFVTFFAVVALFASQINATGFHCSQHVILRNGQQCSLITTGPNKLLRTKDLKILNPVVDCNNLGEETKICVEIDYEYSDMDFELNEYEIEEGDNCEIISEKLNVNEAVLSRVNSNILYCDRIEELVGVSIQYREDGDYEPVFDNSTEILL